MRRLHGQNDAEGFFKNAFDEFIVHGNHAAVNPGHTSTKAGVLHKLTVGAGRSAQIRLRLVGQAPRMSQTSGKGKSQRQARRLSYFEDFNAVLSAATDRRAPQPSRRAKLVSRWHECGQGERQLLSLLRGHRMKCLLRRMLDETEFLSDYGVRAVSKHHEREPYRSTPTATRWKSATGRPNR